MTSCGCILMLIPIFMLIGFVAFGIHPIVGVLYVLFLVGVFAVSFMGGFKG